MNELFSADPIRPAARRGEPDVPVRRAAPNDPWPPRDRDPADVAVVATRVLIASGRIRTRLRAIARSHGADPQLLALLLLFAESNRPLRIGNVAELLGVSHTTASRAAARAQAAGLVDKLATPIDGREVTIRISLLGRAAITRCLAALRPEAAKTFGLPAHTIAHPRAGDLTALLGGPPYLERASENPGWRAGVLAGMWDD
jgi:DNA-binding MarR family transcriptional regulator